MTMLRSAHAAAMTWVDMWGFWVSVLGTAATVAVAVVAVWLSAKSGRDSKESQLRAERVEWVRSYTDYLNGWVRHRAPSHTVRVQNELYYLGYDGVIAEAARLAESTGAYLLLNEARHAMRHIAENEPDDKHLASEDARTQLFKWAGNWVNDPDARPGDIIGWIDRFREGGTEYSTD